MSIDSYATFKWEQLARRQKIYIVAALVLVLVVIGAAMWDSISARLETRQYERQAAEAQRDKDAALTAAANIASQVRQKEDELNKVEGTRDAKQQEVNRAKTDVDRNRADLDAAHKRHRTADEAPSADDLCQQLAALGHPCNPH